MGAVRMKALAGLRRRRLQAGVIAAVVVLATTAATMALDTLVESQAPYDHAFAEAKGAHLVVDYRTSLTGAQLASTAAVTPVTATGGPWPIGTADIAQAPDAGKGGSLLIGGGELSGRADPGGGVDRIAVSNGRWWERPGEIVLSQDWAKIVQGQLGGTIMLRETPIAAKAAAPGSPGRSSGATPTTRALAERTFTVVGIASSISTPDVFAWVSPDDLAALMPHQAPRQEMLYRVAPSATSADLAAALSAIAAAVPPDSVATSQTYLVRKASVDRTASIFVPILLAFSVFALLAAAFIIANVVTGIVLAGYRDIGVMKAVGFTPNQVTWSLLAQILVPVAVGAVVGVALGTALSQPVLADTARSFGLPTAFDLSVPVVGAVLLATFATAILAAIGPAVRAGRLSVVGAITRGTTPSSRVGGGRLRRVALGLPFAAPVRIGLAASVAHPVRAAMTLGALTVGVSALVFSLGLDGSLNRIAGQLERDTASPVRVETNGAASGGGPVLILPGGGGPSGAGPASGQSASRSIAAAIAAAQGTGRSVAIGETDVAVPGLGGAVPFVGYRGDASWIGYALIRGRWFAGPGEAVAPTNVFATAGLHLGDTVTVGANGRSVTVVLVGEIFDEAPENQDDLLLRGTFADLASLEPAIEPTRWEVQPAAGVDRHAYAAQLVAAVRGLAGVEVVDESRFQESFLLFEGVISALGLALIVISLGGVLNTVLLETRQRVRETAVLKTVGMTRRQVVAMVLASIAPIGIMAGIIGVPLGLAFQRTVLGLMGRAASNTGVPESSFDVFPLAQLVVLGLAGLAIGALGAWVPAQRAARAPIVETLQAE
jgi:putative ABC transport system permease protein